MHRVLRRRAQVPVLRSRNTVLLTVERNGGLKLLSVLKLIPKMFLVLILALGPIAVVGLIFWPTAVSAVMSVVTVAMFATAWLGPLKSIQIPAIYCIAVLVIVVSDANPLVSALVVGAVAVATGIYSSAGLAMPAIQIATSIPYIVAEPPEVSFPSGYVQLIIGLVVSSAWGILLGFLVRRFILKKEFPLASVRWLPGIAGGLLLAIVGGCATYYAQENLAGTMWVWILLTFFMLVKADETFNLPKIGHRVAGTLAGSVAAAFVLALALPAAVQPILVMVLMASAFAVMLSGHPYWMFVTALTPAVILMHAIQENPLSLLEERIAYTLIGAVLAIVVGVAINFVIDKLPTGRGFEKAENFV